MTSKATEAYEEAYPEDNEIGEEDYGFVFGPDGEIKYVFVPDVIPFKPPKNIVKIMKILGVSDLSQFNVEEVPLH